MATTSTKSVQFGPGGTSERDAVTGRPNDTPERNSTFAARAKAVQRAENKAVSGNDLEAKTVEELRDMARDASVDGFSTMRKAELVAALN